MLRRSERLAALIQEEAARFIEKNSNMPSGVFMTVTKVEMSQRGDYAKAYVSLFPVRKIAHFLDELRMLEKDFRKHIRQTLPMKNVPRVKFIFDDAELKREQLEKLLEKDENTGNQD